MVLCYGGIALETVIELPYAPKAGVAHIICEERSRLGGGSAHVAEWLASWDIPTRLSGYVLGRDPSGDQLQNWLSAYPSLDLTYLERSDDVGTLVSRTVPFPDGDRYLLCVGYANVTLTRPTAELLADVDVLEVAFYHRQERGNAAALEMAGLAAGRGVKVVAMDMFAPIVAQPPRADIVINSAASIREQHPDIDVRVHGRALQAYTGGVVIVTDGGRELWSIDRDGVEYLIRPPQIRATDSTGAGDSFRAGVIYGLIQHWPLAETLRWATAVGALQVQRSLSQDRPPDRDRILALAGHVDVQALSR